MNGAVFLATHEDINCPTEDGFIPDCGAMCAAISLSTGKPPKYLGKPHKETVEKILKHTGLNLNEIAFIGDRLYTDVACGVNNGAKGMLVLSGETKMEDVAASSIRPDAIFSDLEEVADLL
jgi:Predicted sugar phosphatases of the HAD superfamily